MHCWREDVLVLCFWSVAAAVVVAIVAVAIVVAWPSLGRLAPGSFRARPGGPSRPPGSFQEAPRGFSRPQRPRLAPGCFRRHQEAPAGRRNFNWPQEIFKRPRDSPGGSIGPKRPQKAPGGPRRPQQAPGSAPAQPARLSAACTTTVNTRSTHGQRDGQHAVNTTVNMLQNH